MTLERILDAVVNSMMHGRHKPHCFSAHVPGRGYVNDGSAEYDRADYLRQLERAACSEVVNMGFAPDYAEPGYDNPAKGVLFANWNMFPRGFDALLERAGYATEWSDEWDTCSNCGNAIRIQPDGFDWEPQYRDSDIEQGVILCKECQEDYSC